jgi:acyl dehydratase
MPLSTRLAGTATRPRRHEVDARWLMAYAAGLGDTAPCYFDTTRTIAMHPVFPVCVEWDSILDLRYGPGTETLTAAEQTRAVHADHDIHLLRPPVPGETLSTTATAVAVEQRRPGAYLLKRLDTVDSRGELVMRTWQGTLYRDVAVIGEATAIDSAPAWPAAGDDGNLASHVLAVAANSAHVYTECARIWNPIHTDRAHALAAGLPDIILHGTATLALAVSRLVQSELDDAPGRVTRVGGRFSGMVLMPSLLGLKLESHMPGLIRFRVVAANGRDAIRRGFLEYAP